MVVQRQEEERRQEEQPRRGDGEQPKVQRTRGTLGLGPWPQMSPDKGGAVETKSIIEKR